MIFKANRIRLLSKLLSLSFLHFYLDQSIPSFSVESQSSLVQFKNKRKKKTLSYTPFEINLKEFKRNKQQLTMKKSLMVNNKKVDLVFVKDKNDKVECYIDHCSYGGCGLSENIIDQ